MSNDKPIRAAVVLVAAGSSTRMGSEGASTRERKPWLDLGGASVLERAARAFDAAPSIVEIVVVAHADDVERVRSLARSSPALRKLARVVAGGTERADSVRSGVRALGSLGVDGRIDVIAVHDAARALITTESIERVVAAAVRQGGAILALPVRDTLKRSSDGATALETIERGALFAAQTPQCFRAREFLGVLARAEADGYRPSDDAALWERYVGPVALVPGSSTNLKITTPEDLELARALIRAGETARGAGGVRIGTGFDVHRLVAGRRCVLGGVELEHPSGPLGHSDGDAVLHALADALLGAAGLDDLGTLFSDQDPRWKDAAGRSLFAEVVARVRAAGFRVGNADVVIVTEGPRIAPQRAVLRASIAALLGVELERVNVKGKGVEGLGALAGGAGVAVNAVCLLVKE